MSDGDDRPASDSNVPPPRPAGAGAAQPARPLGTGPILLIALGVLLLAANLGWFRWAELFRLLSYWPAALIAIGIDILTRGRYRAAVILGAIVVALVLWGANVGTQTTAWWAFGPASPARTVAVQHDIEGVGAGRVVLDLGVGRVFIDGDAPPGTLLSGTIRAGSGESISQASSAVGGTKTVEISSEQTGFFNIGRGETRRWDLSLGREVPIALSISAGVGQTTLDLSRVDLSAISYRGGVGESTVTLPAGDFDGTFEMGVGASTIRVPRDAAVRLSVSTGIGRVNVPGDLRRDGDVYTSDGFESARERITLRVNGGVGSITVQRR